MSRIVTFLVVTSLFISSTPMLSAAEPDLVFLLIGQSNMAGRAPLEEDDQASLAGVMLLDAEGKWEVATNPLNRYATDRKTVKMQRLGPGDGFARTLHEELPDQSIGLIVNARGGSNINEWVPGKPLYDHTLERIAKMKQKPKFAGIIWHQGESNANDPEYLTKIIALVKNLRKDLQQPELPFVAGEVFGDKPVNSRLNQLPKNLKGTAVVSAKDLTVFDGVHFDRKSQKVLGSRYAKAWLKIVED